MGGEANTPFRLTGIVQISNNDEPIIADVKWTMQAVLRVFGYEMRMGDVSLPSCVFLPRSQIATAFSFLCELFLAPDQGADALREERCVEWLAECLIER